MKEKKYVDNDVFKFRCTLNQNLDTFDITIYTKPMLSDVNTSFGEGMFILDKHEKFVRDKYFTQEKIDELKLKLVQEIQECKNPFNIYCIDFDGGYNVTEDELFDLNK